MRLRWQSKASGKPRPADAEVERELPRRQLRWRRLLRIYRGRLRNRNVLVQDAFAIAGIAVGVALLFASQVASTSLTRSVQRLSNQLVGSTQYQLDARGSAGMDEQVLNAARKIPGVRVAVPVLEQPAQVIGAHGQERSVDLIGIDPRFAHFGGPLIKRFSSSFLAGERAIALPNPIANAINAGGFEVIELQIGAKVIRTLLGATLGSRDIGSLVNSPVAVAPIAYTQGVTGMIGRVTRVFVQADPGRDAAVLASLHRLASTVHVNVESANFDSKLFSVAALPENQGETLFSVISALVGFLLAINAMLITVPRRRRTLAHLREQGARRRMALRYLLFDTGVLGVIACVVGLALGDGLSIWVFHSQPGYLSFAFPVGSGRILTWQSFAEAIAAGMAAAFAGLLFPLRELVMPATWRVALSHSRWAVCRALLGVAGFAVTTVILIVHPAYSNLGNFTLVVALLCVLPSLFNASVAGFSRVQPSLHRASPRMTVRHLRKRVNRTLFLAIIAIAAVATFGVTSIQGAQTNLQRGLDASAHGIDSGAAIWVTPRGESNAFATTPFSDPAAHAAITSIPGVRTVGEYRGSFLDWRARRLWVLGPSANGSHLIPPSEIVSGNLALADRRLREGGWAVLSRELAAEHGLHVGQAFTLPSPEPMTFRVAALSTNLGWPPGAVIVNSEDYSRAWASSNPSGFEIDTQPGVSAAAVRHAIQAVLGPHTGLVVETSGEREQRHYALASQGLLRLTQIRFLVLIAAMLAIAGALGSLIWQRRGYVAFVRALGFKRPVLRRWLLLEGLVLLGVGCLTGALFGVYGQLLMSHALASVTGFPISFNVEALVALTTLAVVTTAVVVVVSIAGYFMVRVQPRAARPAS
jgi:putative ABC transport system permease protein